MSDKEWAPDEDFEEAMADAGESEQEEVRASLPLAWAH